MAMVWGMVMIVVVLLLWSILTVELVNHRNQLISHESNWCYQAFSAVERCMLFYFQTIFAGDSWGVCTIPLIHENIAYAIVFAGALVTINLGFTNLILAVVVDRATTARIDDE